jgi:hypothetical protein
MPFLKSGSFFSDPFTVTIKGQTQINSDPKTQTQKLRPTINKKLIQKTENHN